MIKQSQNFTVYDNTCTKADCINIIKLANEFTKNKMDIHSSYKRSNLELDDPQLLLNNPFEYIIEDCLRKFHDKSAYVEYWYRSLWIDLNCHQDLNEDLLSNEDIVVNPNNGHILYLSNQCIEAPTVIFGNNMHSVSCVYPRVGRLVRFDGKTFHYVPNPFTYMFENDDLPIYGQFRPVLLFNTWNDYKGKSLHCKTLKRLKLQPLENWKKLDVHTVKLTNSCSLRVKYMRNSQRRFFTKKVEKFIVNRRFQTDGFHYGIIQYLIEKIH